MTARVLVVEDDTSIRGLLATLLENEGHDVVTAEDGLAGLVAAGADVPDLVLLDLVMPDLGGRRVLEELRADPRTADVPVIVVTGRPDEAAALLPDVGAADVVGKPFAVEDLLGRVRAVLDAAGRAGGDA